MKKIPGFNRACLIFLVSFLVLGMPGAWSAAERKPFDHSALDRFLKKYVDEKGAFDFRAAKQDPALLDEYLGQIENVNLIELVIWPREEKLAFWLNAYHAGLLKAILDHYPIRSVHDIPGIWEVPLVLIGGRRFSLNAIQTQQLIDVFRDEKIHCALACSGKSCPPFQTEAFTGPRVEGQLFMATRRL